MKKWIPLVLVVACGGPSPAVTANPAPLAAPPAPTAPTVVPRYQAVVTSGFGSCALSEGRVYCWGRFDAGVGHNPEHVPGLDGAVSIGAGMPVHALMSDGRVLAFDDKVELVAKGMVTLASHDANVCGLAPSGIPWCRFRMAELEPREVTGLGRLAEIAVARDHLCGVTFEGSVRCVGNSDGLVYDANGVFHWESTSPIRHLVGGAHQICGVDDQGLVCIGASFHGRWPKKPTISAVSSHRVCFVEEGGVRCRGGSAEDETTPIADVTHLSCTDEHCCARQAFGRFACWGSRRGGQLGDGFATQFYDKPRVVALGKKAIGLLPDLCAQVDDGVRCWGRPRDKALWSPEDAAIVWGHPLTKSPYVAVGGSCALDRTGRLVCRHGEGKATLEGISSFVEGTGRVCALGKDQKVRCLTDSADKPQVLAALSGSVEIAHLRDSVCGRKADGKVVCDGDAFAIPDHPSTPPSGVDALVELRFALCTHRKQDGWTCIDAKGKVTEWPTAKQIVQVDDGYCTLEGDGVYCSGWYAAKAQGKWGFPSVPKAITAGDGALCGWMEDGRVLCMGDATDGGMGDGVNYGPTGPVQVALP